MASTRYTDGNVTVELDDGLDALMRSALNASEAETLRILEKVGDDHAQRAQAAWYDPKTGVRRRTGKSGDIRRVTTFTADGVKVSVGSTDKSRVGRKPRVLLIRRAGRLALDEKRVTQKEWWAWKKKSRPVGPTGTPGQTDWIIYVPSPRANDGRVVMNELVKKPVRREAKRVAPDIGKAIADATVRGSNGV